MNSTTPSSRAVTKRNSVDRNDRQVVAVEEPTPEGNSIVAAIDPLVDRQVLEQLVDEVLVELDRVHVDGPEIVADTLQVGRPCRPTATPTSRSPGSSRSPSCTPRKR